MNDLARILLVNNSGGLVLLVLTTWNQKVAHIGYANVAAEKESLLGAICCFRVILLLVDVTL